MPKPRSACIEGTSTAGGTVGSTVGGTAGANVPGLGVQQKVCALGLLRDRVRTKRDADREPARCELRQELPEVPHRTHTIEFQAPISIRLSMCAR